MGFTKHDMFLIQIDMRKTVKIKIKLTLKCLSPAAPHAFISIFDIPIGSLKDDMIIILSF